MDLEEDMQEAKRIRSAVAEVLEQGLYSLVFPGDFVQLQVSLGNKYVKLDLEDLIRKNAKAHGWGERLNHAVAQLYSVGRELMKPPEERSEMWDYISIADTTYLDILKDIEGHIHILKLFGYKEVPDAFLYEDDPSVWKDKVALTAELYLAEADLACYVRESHPFANMFDCLVPPIFRKPAALANDSQKELLENGNMAFSTPVVHHSIPEKQECPDNRDPNVYLQNGADPSMSAADVADQCARETNGLESFLLVPDVPEPPVQEPSVTESYAKEQADLLAEKSDVPQSLSSGQAESLKSSFGTDLRCHQCQFINLPDAELCISCAEPLDCPVPPDHDGNSTMNGFGTEPDPEERRCPTCTFMNPVTTNICLMCYNSVIDEGNTVKQGSSDLQTGINAEPGLAEEHTGVIPPDAEPSLNGLEEASASTGDEPTNQTAQDEIYCPECGSVCHRELGGFRQRKCSNCQFSFCDGCKAPFKLVCKKFRECPRDPHCHHPRDCVFYVQHCSLEELKRILTENGVEHDGYRQWLEKEANSLGQRPLDLENEHRATEGNKLCYPYKEYIIRIIQMHKLDPASVMKDEILRTIIRQEYGGEPKEFQLENTTIPELVQKIYPLYSSE